MDELDFTHSSRKSWAQLKKLGASQPTHKENCVNANVISANIYKWNQSGLKDRIKYSIDKFEMKNDLTTDEINAVLLKIKNGKVAGKDDILPEFLKILGIRGKMWLVNRQLLISARSPKNGMKLRLL